MSSSSSAQTPAATRQGGESKKSWALPGGSELCPGDDDERCNLASDGSGAQGLADESGGCVFCNPNRLRAALRMRRGAVMTHVLSRFPDDILQRALRQIEKYVGKVAATQWKLRVARCQWRRDPRRPRLAVKCVRARQPKPKCARKRKKSRRTRRRCKTRTPVLRPCTGEDERFQHVGSERTNDCWGVAIDDPIEEAS